MIYSRYTLSLASCLAVVAAFVTPLNPAIQIRNAPGASSADTYRAVGRALLKARNETGNVVLNGNATLDRSWNNAVLFAYAPTKDATQNIEIAGGIEITCTTCYVKGLAKAQLTIADGFDADKAFQQTIDSVHDEIERLTESVENQFKVYVQSTVTKLSDGIDTDDFAFPTINATFNVDVPAIPQTDLQFTFDGLEMYIELDTSLSVGATYTLNLFSSNSIVGISGGKALKVGLVFTIDLILAVEGAINISNGFHIKLDDGITINIPLFDDKVGNLVFNGGQFEFLPVTIESAGVVLSATLRIGAQVGFEITTGAAIGVFPAVSGGIEVGVFANIAELITNVTVASDDDECDVRVVQGYQFALGAQAGATVMVKTEEYGPAYETSVPIWYTELADVCGIKGKSTPTPTPAVTPRAIANRVAEYTTTTLTTPVTYTGVACMESTLVDCPVSLQTTTQYTSTKTLITTALSGMDVDFPETTFTSVPSTVTFGSNVQTLTATSGSPVSYVPPPPSDVSTKEHDDSDDNSDDDSDDDRSFKEKLNGEIGGVNKKAVIGGSVGGGIALIAIIGGLLFLWSRRKSQRPQPLKVNNSERYEMMRDIPTPHDDGGHHEGGMYSDTAYTGHKQPEVAVTSYR